MSTAPQQDTASGTAFDTKKQAYIPDNASDPGGSHIPFDSVDHYYHPATEDEIRGLVLFANGTEDGIIRKIRCKGSAHSVSDAIYAGPEQTGPHPGIDDKRVAPGNPNKDINIVFDKFKAILKWEELADKNALVTVQAGIHLGRQPFHSTSTWENSLNWALQKKGYAFPDLGGVSQQTVSGFMIMGCAGGGLQNSFLESVMAFKIMDGNGEIHVLSRDDPDQGKKDQFFAAGVSMGLFGIITEITFKVVPTFDIQGGQFTTDSKNTELVDFFSTGSDDAKKLPNWLKTTDYARILWWPQKGYDGIQIWHANTVPVQPSEKHQAIMYMNPFNSLVGCLLSVVVGNWDAVKDIGDLLSVPYGFYWSYFQSDFNPQTGEPQGLNIEPPCPAIDSDPKNPVWKDFDYTKDWTQELLLDEDKGMLALIMNIIYPMVCQESAELGEFVKAFVALMREMATLGWTDPKSQTLMTQFKEGPLVEMWGAFLGVVLAKDESLDKEQKLLECWRCGLPMDDVTEESEIVWNQQYSELWFPMERCEEVIAMLRTYFSVDTAEESFDRCGQGFNAVEIYTTTASDFWMSPAYKRDVFRLDPTFYQANSGSPIPKFYQPLWDMFKDYKEGFRPHWAKFLPPHSTEWQQYYREKFPKMNDWLQLRKQYDPKGIFATQYWIDNLGIEL